MGRGGQNRLRKGAVFFSLLVLFADMSGLVLASDVSEVETPSFAPPILIDGLPPLMCDDELCERPTRMLDRGERPAAEDDFWWLSYGPDLDWNGVDDRLQRVIDGAESDSPTAIIGPDGHKTVAIVIDFAWHPQATDVQAVRTILKNHGWVDESGGAWFQVLDSLDSIVVDKVPVSSLMPLYFIEGVVVLEMQNIMVPFNGVASQASRAMPSDVYSATNYARGYTGEGVVIAVLDTGVDNEHRALNDFDDADDEPDSDATSYNDQKWVAGFDATSSASNPDGTVDPDDGSGHGTHVAGTALGTGGPSRVHTGTGMGAYLVDIKVLTDAGGTNSQASLNGIQWMINNVDTDWGNNDSSRGIDIGQMSFGSVSSPLNPGDEGDNGSGAEARLVNDATDAGIVCVVAMGNDGTKRVPSPASADGAISIGAVNDRNSVNRTDDVLADYTNWGPRLDDGDDDEWDELKPDITSFGTGIMSASASTGPTIPGAPERPLADDDYESKDGTSMATPVVSGIVATLLHADDNLSPEEIKDILRNSSESRGVASEPDISNRWNEKWGFGLVDASCALDFVLDRSCTPLEDDGGVVVDPPPGGEGLGSHISMSGPNNGSMHLSGDTMSIEGTADLEGAEYVEVQVKLEQYTDDGESEDLTMWMSTDGTIENWYLDLTIDDGWIASNEEYTVVYARGLTSEGEASTVDVRVIHLARMAVTFTSPSLGTDLVGSVEFTGTAEGTEHERVEYKINNEAWVTGENLQPQEDGIQDWSFSWDSTTVEDGSHRISIRMVNESGAMSDALRRTYNVDNLPAAPNFGFYGSVEIFDAGLPVNSAVAGTVLEIRFGIRNIGDLEAEDVLVKVDASGTASTTYPSETRLPSIGEGDSQQVTLYWLATEPGLQDVIISIDPSNQFNDPDRENNAYSFTFQVDERPLEPMLRFLPGAARLSPSGIPNPGVPFELKIRVDNLGQTEATGLNLGLERLNDDIGAWDRIDDSTLAIVPGSSTASGFAYASFNDVVDDIGGVSYRAILSGSGVEIGHNELRFNLTVSDESVGGSGVGVDLDTGEVPVEFIGLDDGALLFTTLEGQLRVRTVSSAMSLEGDVILESNWGGELAVHQREDGLIQAAWTRKALSTDGYMLTDIAMTSISASGKTTPKHYHMPALKLVEGSYWGLDFDEYDGTMVLAGYHRNLATGGSWQDITSIFVLSSSSPDRGPSWGNATTVLSNIDIRAADGQSLAIGLGEEYLHVMYQEYRDDVTGIERVGLMYTHGSPTESSWGFQSSIGDEATSPVLEVLVVEGEDRLIAAWGEGRGKTAELVTAVTDSIWSLSEPNRLLSPGIQGVELSVREEGVYVYHDEINVFGPITRMGLVSDTEGQPVDGLSNILGLGFLFGIAPLESDTLVNTITVGGSYNLRKVVSLSSSNKPIDAPSFIDLLLEPLPGSPATQRMILGGVALFTVLFLLGVVVAVRRGRSEVEDLVFQEDTSDMVELMIQPEDDSGPLLSIDEDAQDDMTVSGSVVAVMDDESDEPTLAEELEMKVDAGEGNARLQRRMQRKQQREFAQMAASLSSPPAPMPTTELPQILPLPELPLPDLPLPAPMMPLPDLKREAKCPECQAAFTVKDLLVKRLVCPICSNSFNL